MALMTVYLVVPVADEEFGVGNFFGYFQLRSYICLVFLQSACVQESRGRVT